MNAPIALFQRLMESALEAYKVDSRYAEQMLLAANTVQLKRNTWEARKNGTLSDKKLASLAATQELLRDAV